MKTKKINSMAVRKGMKLFQINENLKIELININIDSKGQKYYNIKKELEYVFALNIKNAKKKFRKNINNEYIDLFNYSNCDKSKLNKALINNIPYTQVDTEIDNNYDDLLKMSTIVTVGNKDVEYMFKFEKTEILVSYNVRICSRIENDFDVEDLIILFGESELEISNNKKLTKKLKESIIQNTISC